MRVEAHLANNPGQLHPVTPAPHKLDCTLLGHQARLQLRRDEEPRGRHDSRRKDQHNTVGGSLPINRGSCPDQ